MSLTLYSYFRSSSTYRVRIALNLKGLSYEIKPVHLIKDGGQQNKEDYKNLSPMGEVPCLIHDNEVLTQSVAIIEYLDQVFSETRLYPNDPFACATVRQICEIVNSGIQPIQNLKVLQKLEKDFKADQDIKNAWARHWIKSGFDGLEKVLAKTCGNYSFGDEVTAADCFIIPQVFNARRFQVDMKPYPHIQKIHDNCAKLPAFIKASPENQPDFE